LAFVDLEMTGLDETHDRVIEICIERVVGGVTREALHTLVRPEGGPRAEPGWPDGVHGIAPADVASAPAFAAIAERVLDILSGAVLVAHAASYDARFLEMELARAGRPTKIAHFLDTLVLSRRVFGFPSHALARLGQELGAPPGRSHRASDDVRTLRHVFEAVCAELQPASPRDLWETEIGRRRARPAILATLAEASACGDPVRVRYRPSGKPPVDLVLVVIRVSGELDPPRVIGYLLPSRGRRELRADRILCATRTSPP
jgi:DNA polymerase-3 subunit epsilon